MNKKPFDDIVSALLSMKRAIFEMITPSLRAVTVNLDMEKEIYTCYFFYDGPIDDNLFDLASCTAAEASDAWFCDAHYIQLDFPFPIPVNGALAYLRKEPGVSPPEVRLLPRDSRTLAKIYLSYAMQQGLLGRVIPSLRAVTVNVDEEKKVMHFYFYYDEIVNEELLRLSREAIHIAKKAFSEGFTVVEEIVFFPFPKRIPSVGGAPVYHRHEVNLA